MLHRDANAPSFERNAPQTKEHGIQGLKGVFTQADLGGAFAVVGSEHDIVTGQSLRIAGRNRHGFRDLKAERHNPSYSVLSASFQLVPL